MWDEDYSRDLSSDTRRLLTDQNGADLGSDQSCLDMLVQHCTVNHPPLNELKVLLHTQLHVCFDKQITALSSKGQVKNRTKIPIKRKHMKKCDAFTFLGALEDKSCL